ncbi:MAG TPA: glycosyltransferase [Fibrobacteria bacterium]|nr:glycosyltransferase [Fibrobacteria bacterium]
MAIGFNLIGFATANFGLGVALRNTASLLKGMGHPFCVLDIDPGGNRTGHDFSARAHFVEAGRPLPHPVNLFHMNPPGVEGLFRDLPGLVDMRAKRNICVPYWELPKLPLSWKPVLDGMDLVLAPSHFVRQAIADAGVSAPCKYYRQTLSLPRAVPDRGRWNLPDGRTVFLFSFDVSSGMQRKNPLAVMEAFRAAFPSGGALLLIKVNNPDLSPEARLVVERFKAATAGMPDIRILDRSMAYEEVASLFASIDVYVSLHRGEGLGLGMMECMALGKPVIATAWSGNVDFMDGSNSCPVPYTLVPLDPGTQYFSISKGVNQLWAEPSIEAAARWMSRLEASPGLRADIGGKAKASIKDYLAEASRGRVFTEIESLFKNAPDAA